MVPLGTGKLTRKYGEKSVGHIFELIGLTGIVIFKMNNLTEAEHNKILPAFGR